MRRNSHRTLLGIALSLAFLALGGCTNHCNHPFYKNGSSDPGDETNSAGRLLFGSAVSISKSSSVRVEWSTDNFATVTGSTSVGNPYGLVTTGFKACVPWGTNLAYRAYEDLNGNGALDSGEPSGRYDGTENGNASFITRMVDNPKNKDDFPEIHDVDITLDTP